MSLFFLLSKILKLEIVMYTYMSNYKYCKILLLSLRPYQEWRH